MVDDGVAQRPGDLVLQRLDALRLELDDVAGLDVYQVVVVVAAGLLEARGAALEGMAAKSREFLAGGGKLYVEAGD